MQSYVVPIIIYLTKQLTLGLEEASMALLSCSIFTSLICVTRSGYKCHVDFC